MAHAAPCGARFSVQWRHSCRHLPALGFLERSRNRDENLPHNQHSLDMEELRRRLPHVYPEGRWLFLTWHLDGSLPQGLYPNPGHLKGGEAFVWMDRYLDSARHGPSYLRLDSVARVVLDALRKSRDLGSFDLGPYVLMPNHVHALLLPKIPPPQLLRVVKGTSAREANRILGLSGKAFWQRESYDHWVRSEVEWKRIAAYIENNPVRAGLAQCAEEYAWSSAGLAEPERLAEDGGRNAATAR